MEDCLFCKIIKGEIPSFKIYEDEYVYSFLDISNDCNGHILVIPKKHFENIFDCEEEYLVKISYAIKLISNHLTKNCDFDGVNIINSSGKDAEQTILHLHFHILPRKRGENKKIFPSLLKNEKSLEEICRELKIN